MRRRTKIIIGIVVLVIAGVLTAGFASRRGKDITPVTYGKVTRQDLTSKVSANGRIDAKRKVDLSANVMGQVVNLAVREGDVVKKDDFLLQIDQKQLAATARSADAALQAVFSDRDAAKAMAVAAEQDYQRALKNYEQKITPRSELDRAQSSRDSARANVMALEQRISQARENLNAARDTLQKTTMRAPMAGIVTALPVEEGEVAVIGTMNNAGTVLMTIADMSVVEAVMEVDETDVPAVKVGQRANVTIDAYPNKTFPGLVTEVGVESDQAKRNQRRERHRGRQLRGQDPDRESAAGSAAGILRIRRHHHRHASESAGHPDPGAGRARETGQHARQAARRRRRLRHHERRGEVPARQDRPLRRQLDRDRQRREGRRADRHRPLPRAARDQGRHEGEGTEGRKGRRTAGIRRAKASRCSMLNVECSMKRRSARPPADRIQHSTLNIQHSTFRF